MVCCEVIMGDAFGPRCHGFAATPASRSMALRVSIAIAEWGDHGAFYLPQAYLANVDLATDAWTITACSK